MDQSNDQQRVDPVEGDMTGGVIPYKNVPALVAYYLGVFSLIPCVAVPLGIAAVICGILGLIKRQQHPQVRGAIHAWIGIVLGALTAAANVVVIALISQGTW